MLRSDSSLPLLDLVQQAKTAIILLSANPSYDTVASGLSLALALKEAGKDVQIGCSSPMLVEFTHLVGVDEVKEKVGNRNLQISFDYVDAAVDRVSYSISEDNKTFHLIIAPKTGAKALQAKDVRFQYVGAEADVVFVIGATSLHDLAQVYEAEKEFFDAAYTVALTKDPVDAFARMHFHAQEQTCLAEGMMHFLSGLKMSPSEDSASNLLSSIELATNRFQSLNMSAETFEVVARLLRAGARRSPFNPAFAPANPNAEHFIPADKPTNSVPLFAQALQQSGQKQSVDEVSREPEQSVKTPPNAIYSPGRKHFSRHKHFKSKHMQNPPEDWMKPKVFTGSSQTE